MNSTPYTHIHEKFRHVPHLTDKERIEFIHTPRWIGYKTANQILKTLKDLMERPRQHRMPNLLIIGDSNNGKTTIIKRFNEKFGDTYVDDNERINVPVRLIQAPPSANEKELYISLIDSLGLPFRSSDSTAILRRQLVHSFLETHVKILIIDEAHSILTGTARQQRQMMDAIKYLCNALELPIILCGTKDAVRVLHTDSQHSSRFDVAELPIWRNDDEFRRLLGSFEKILPLKNPSNLIDIEKTNLIHSISDGNLGNVKRLLNECAIEAINTGEETITLDIIRGKSCLRPTKGLRKIIG